jgi:hypothetical protein
MAKVDKKYFLRIIEVMKKLFLLTALFSYAALAQSGDALKPFATDYCTGYAEGTRTQPDLWKHCCVEHDLYFWAGGSREDRKATDLRLKHCVEATGAVGHARLIYSAVKIGGSSPIRFKSREWGNAFVERERYQALTSEETALIIQHLKNQDSELTPELKNLFYSQLNSRLVLP